MLGKPAPNISIIFDSLLDRFEFNYRKGWDSLSLFSGERAINQIYLILISDILSEHRTWMINAVNKLMYNQTQIVGETNLLNTHYLLFTGHGKQGGTRWGHTTSSRWTGAESAGC